MTPAHTDAEWTYQWPGFFVGFCCGVLFMFILRAIAGGRLP